MRAAELHLKDALDWGSREVILAGNGQSIEASLASDLGVIPDLFSSVQGCRRPLWLAFRREYPLTVSVDAVRLSSFAAKISARLDQTARDARLSFGEGDQVVVLSDEPGWSLDSTKFAAMFLGAERFFEIPNAIDLPFIETPPAVCARDLEMYLPFERVAVFRTYYVDGNNRAHNISLACSPLSEVTVGPGQTFSFNQTVGPRSMERGYRKAPVFVGDETVDDFGGGVCQISTTLYISMLKAGFDVAERYCHAKPVVYVPMGFDATVSYDYLDLRMSNPGDAPCLVRAIAKNGELTAEVFGRPLPDLRIEVESRVLKELPAEGNVEGPPALGPGTGEGAAGGEGSGVVKPKLRSGFLVETVRKWVRGGQLERVERLDTSMYPAEKPKTR